MSHSNLQLCQLAYDGNIGHIQKLLAENNDLLHKRDQDGRTALHWAASAGNVDITKLLLSHNAKVCIYPRSVYKISSFVYICVVSILCYVS